MHHAARGRLPFSTTQCVSAGEARAHRQPARLGDGHMKARSLTTMHAFVAISCLLFVCPARAADRNGASVYPSEEQYVDANGVLIYVKTIAAPAGVAENAGPSALPHGAVEAARQRDLSGNARNRSGADNSGLIASIAPRPLMHGCTGLMATANGAAAATRRTESAASQHGARHSPQGQVSNLPPSSVRHRLPPADF